MMSEQLSPNIVLAVPTNRMTGGLAEVIRGRMAPALKQTIEFGNQRGDNLQPQQLESLWAAAVGGKEQLQKEESSGDSISSNLLDVIITSSRAPEVRLPTLVASTAPYASCLRRMCGKQLASRLADPISKTHWYPGSRGQERVGSGG